MNKHGIDYTVGSGNVFQDMGLPDAEERLAKAKLAMCIETIIRQHGWTQVQAAERLGIKQPKVSALMNGQLRGFSMEKLISYLNQLNQNVEMIVCPQPGRGRSQGHLRVVWEGLGAAGG